MPRLSDKKNIPLDSLYVGPNTQKYELSQILHSSSNEVAVKLLLSISILLATKKNVVFLPLVETKGHNNNLTYVCIINSPNLLINSLMLHLMRFFTIYKRLAIKIGEHTQRGKKAFKSLVALHPHDIEILRNYADFLAEVCNEDEESSRLMTKADLLSHRRHSSGSAVHQQRSSDVGLNPKAGNYICDMSISRQIPRVFWRLIN
jgi:hypothetical protein